MSISVIPGYQSGQRLASLKSAMASCGEALIWTLRCTIAIVDLLALSCVVPLRDGTGRAAGIEPDLPSCHDRSLGGQAGAPALRGLRVPRWTRQSNSRRTC